MCACLFLSAIIYIYIYVCVCVCVSVWSPPGGISVFCSR